MRLIRYLGWKTLLATVLAGLVAGSFTWLMVPPLPRVSIPTYSSIGRRAFSGDGRYLASAEGEFTDKRTWKGEVHVWDTHEPRLLFSIPHTESFPPVMDGGYSLAFTPDAGKVVTFGWGKAKYYQMPTGKEWTPEDTLKLPPLDWNRSSRLVSDSRQNLYVMIHDEERKTLSIHDFDTGRQLSSWGDAPSVPEVFAGCIIESARALNVREIPGGEIRHSLPFRIVVTSSLQTEYHAVTPDCRTFVKIDHHVQKHVEGEVKNYELRADQFPAISPDGRLLAALVHQGHNYNWHTRWLAKLGFGGRDSTFVIYDLDTASEMARMQNVNHAHFMLDGKTLALFTDHSVDLYDLPLRSPWGWTVGVACGGALLVCALAQCLGRQRNRKAKPSSTEAPKT